MDENNIIQEVVKEYILDVDGLNTKVRARIVKKLNLDPEDTNIYEWQISHFCKQIETAATVYIPSVICSNDLESCEFLLMRYLKNFRNIDVEENTFY